MGGKTTHSAHPAAHPPALLTVPPLAARFVRTTTDGGIDYFTQQA